MRFCSRVAQTMDSESSAFSTEGSFLSVLIIFAVFLATVFVAMVLVLARRSCLAAESQPDEDNVPPTRLGWPADVRQPTEESPQTQEEQVQMLEHWSLQHSPAHWRPVRTFVPSRHFVTFRIQYVADLTTTFYVEIKAWRTVFMLLLVMQREACAPIADICYHGRKLREDRTLYEYGIRNGDFIELTLFPTSGIVSI